jgi:hypothetical protein
MPTMTRGEDIKKGYRLQATGDSLRSCPSAERIDESGDRRRTADMKKGYRLRKLRTGRLL